MATKVSIIIPTWNRAQYLTAAIQSALNQTYEHTEVIVADNASTDETREIAKSYKEHANFKYYRNETNIGARFNFNRALFEYASGDYVLILSDDDELIDEHYISKAMDVVNNNGNIALIFSNFNYVHDNGTILLTTKFNVPQNMNDGKWLWVNYGSVAWCPLLTTIFSRKIAIELGGFILDIPGMDMLLFLQLLLMGEFGFIPGIVANYRVHATNDSKNMNESLETNYRNLERIRLAAKFAIKREIPDHIVHQWEEKMMVRSLTQIIWDFCVSRSLQGDFMWLQEIYKLAHRSGDEQRLHKAMVEVMAHMSKISNFSQIYRKMDITLR